MLRERRRSAGRAVGATFLAAVAFAVLPSTAAAAVCSDYPDQASAQRAADTEDRDGDGIYCEWNPCPCLNPDDAGARERARARRRAAARRRAEARRRAAERRRRAERRRKAAARRERQAIQRTRRRVAESPARIVDVLDGDTVKVEFGAPFSRTENVRLIGIDAPETRAPGSPAECGGREAAAFLLGATFPDPSDADGDGLLDRRGGEGVRVRATTDPTQDLRDRYGRLLAYVDITAGPALFDPSVPDLAQTALAAGWAEVDIHDRVFNRIRPFAAAQDGAAASGHGVWALCEGDYHRAAGR